VRGRSHFIRILILGGPTCSGKSAVALRIAREFSAEIINGDSRQIYRGMSIGTNQPSKNEQREIPHHLFGFLEPSRNFSATEYENMAVPVIEEVNSRSKLALIVGGSGFYLKSLLKGAWMIPAADPKLRNRLRKIEKDRGKEYLHRLLQRVDPKSAAEVNPADAYRVGRSLEIYFQTGQKRSAFRTQRPDRFEALKYTIGPPMTKLRADIAARTDGMLAAGWLDETRELITKYPDFWTFPAAASLGYPEIRRHLAGELDLAECSAAITLKTSQYAKRQLTWFRNQDAFSLAESSEGVYKMIKSVLE
jgi:tRNA dimethylallyltransferase